MRYRPFFFLAFLLLLAGPVASAPSGVAAESCTIPVSGGLQLPGVFDLPAGPARGVLVLLHGSGAHSRDEDLGEVTEGKVPNPFFRSLGGALVGRGFAVLRYDKRNFVVRHALPGALSRQGVEELTTDPAGTYVADARAALAVARARFPGLPVFLLGHSEGTWVALQAAREDGAVPGVALLGYSGASLEALVVEQLACRPLEHFRALDANGDGVLDASELAAPEAAALARQLPVLDLDGQGTLSVSEFQAGNLANLLLKPLVPDSWRKGEGARPSSADLVRHADFRLLFLQGEWDNQTPACYARAVEIAERSFWKKGNKRFRYFPRAGHALDPRRSWDDLVYRPTPPETLDAAAAEVEDFFLGAPGSAP